MAQSTSDNQPSRLRGALTGAALVFAGALTLGFLIYISNSQAQAHLMMSLGLAGSALLSAIAQGLIFFGGWTLWKASRPRAR